MSRTVKLAIAMLEFVVLIMNLAPLFITVASLSSFNILYNVIQLVLNLVGYGLIIYLIFEKK